MKEYGIQNLVLEEKAIYVAGYLSDSVIANVINKNLDCPILGVYREDGLNNVKTCNLL